MKMIEAKPHCTQFLSHALHHMNIDLHNVWRQVSNIVTLLVSICSLDNLHQDHTSQPSSSSLKALQSEAPAPAIALALRLAPGRPPAPHQDPPAPAPVDSIVFAALSWGYGELRHGIAGDVLPSAPTPGTPLVMVGVPGVGNGPLTTLASVCTPDTPVVPSITIPTPNTSPAAVPVTTCTITLTLPPSCNDGRVGHPHC